MNIKTLFTLALLIIYSSITLCNSPYILGKKQETLIIGTSSIFLGFDLGLNVLSEPMSKEKLSGLNIDHLTTLNQKAIENYSESAKKRSDITMFASAGLSPLMPIAIGLRNSELKQQELFTLYLLLFEANMVNLSLTETCKMLYKKPRPYIYNPNVPLAEKLDKDSEKSFFSGHTSIAATNSFFIAKVFSDYYPNSNLKPWIWGAAALLPLSTGRDRYLAGKHFIGDIVTGYIVGAACGILIPELHKKSRKNEISIIPHINKHQKSITMVWHL